MEAIHTLAGLEGDGCVGNFSIFVPIQHFAESVSCLSVNRLPFIFPFDAFHF